MCNKLLQTLSNDEHDGIKNIYEVIYKEKQKHDKLFKYCWDDKLLEINFEKLKNYP
jgi:hypothetical protein